MADSPVFDLPVGVLCAEIPAIDPCALLLPGGVDFEDQDLLRFAQPALAPFLPMFRVLEAVVAIKNCIEAIPDALGPPPDPTAVAACIPALAEKIAALLELMPQVSVPVMVARLIDCIIRELEQLRIFLLGLIAQVERIAQVLERAAELDDPNLALVASCGTDRVAQTLDDQMKALVVVGRLLGMVRLLMDLVGLPTDLIPDFTTVSSAPLEDAIAPLDAMLDALRAVRQTVLAAVPE